jgi:alpha-ribazole phosphatase
VSASTWLYLIRHGEVEHAAEGRFFGHTDVALSATGLAQVESLARRLAAEPIEAVYASDLQRARQTAGPLAAARGVAATLVPALREVAMGRWEGLTFAEIRERDPGPLAAWLADLATCRFPEGENLGELRERVLGALDAILARHAGRRIAVVAHGGTNRVILAEALGLPLEHVMRLAQDYAAWSLIEFRRSGAVLHTMNQPGPGIAGADPVERTVVR